jgi:hypothetical protein
MGKKDGDEFSAEETARRRDDVIRRMANTPPKPHSAMIVGKRKAKAKSAQTAKRERSK